jgi:hypothetical protein
MSKSDLLTRVYALAALYTDIAERHQLAKDQGAVDTKGLFNDLKIRLEAQFELTKDQMVCIYNNIHLQIDADLSTLV